MDKESTKYKSLLFLFILQSVIAFSQNGKPCVLKNGIIFLAGKVREPEINFFNITPIQQSTSQFEIRLYSDPLFGGDQNSINHFAYVYTCENNKQNIFSYSHIADLHWKEKKKVNISPVKIDSILNALGINNFYSLPDEDSTISALSKKGVNVFTLTRTRGSKRFLIQIKAGSQLRSFSMSGEELVSDTLSPIITEYQNVLLLVRSLFDIKN